MVSFDVTNLFTSIPVEESVLFVRNLLESRLADRSKVVDVVSLLRICLRQNRFSIYWSVLRTAGQIGDGELFVLFFG